MSPYVLIKHAMALQLCSVLTKQMSHAMHAWQVHVLPAGMQGTAVSAQVHSELTHAGLPACRCGNTPQSHPIWPRISSTTSSEVKL